MLSRPVSDFLPQLATPLAIFDRQDSEGNAIYHTTSTEITLAMLLNQSAGFGGEFKEQVVGWKSTLKPGQPGAGFVNSCKIVRLHPPPCLPGQPH